MFPENQPKFYRSGTLAIVGILLVATQIAPAQADESPYARDRRAAYVSRALDALRAMDPDRLDTLQRDLYLGGRKQCRADFGPPTASCLIDLARTRCQSEPTEHQSSCRLVADILITNQLAERELINDQTRALLMGRGTSFHQAMQDELMNRYADLVARMTLKTPSSAGDASPGGALGVRIDDFCTDHARSHRLAWPRCISAITWYIATGDRDARRAEIPAPSDTTPPRKPGSAAP